MDSKFSIVIDFDSTIISVETLEYLANISLYNKPNRDKLMDQISNYTNLAMNGEITFEESLDMRFNLMEITKNDIEKAIDELIEKIDKSFLRNLHFFEAHFKSIYIISGGFKSIIEFVLSARSYISVFLKGIAINNFT